MASLLQEGRVPIWYCFLSPIRSINSAGIQYTGSICFTPSNPSMDKPILLLLKQKPLASTSCKGESCARERTKKRKERKNDLLIQNKYDKRRPCCLAYRQSLLLPNPLIEKNGTCVRCQTGMDKKARQDELDSLG